MGRLGINMAASLNADLTKNKFKNTVSPPLLPPVVYRVLT